MALRRADCGIHTTAARVRVAIYRAALATTLSAVGNVDAAHVHADAAATRLSAALTGVADRVAALVSEPPQRAVHRRTHGRPAPVATIAFERAGASNERSSTAAADCTGIATQPHASCGHHHSALRMLHHVATDGVQETRADALRAHTDGRADAAQRACAERTDAVERTLREVLQPALYYSTAAALAAPWAAGRGRLCVCRCARSSRPYPVAQSSPTVWHWAGQQ